MSITKYNKVDSNSFTNDLISIGDRSHDSNGFSLLTINIKTLGYEANSSPEIGDANYQFKGFGTGATDVHFKVKNSSNVNGFNVFGNGVAIASQGFGVGYSNGQNNASIGKTSTSAYTAYVLSLGATYNTYITGVCKNAGLFVETGNQTTSPNAYGAWIRNNSVTRSTIYSTNNYTDTTGNTTKIHFLNGNAANLSCGTHVVYKAVANEGRIANWGFHLQEGNFKFPTSSANGGTLGEVNDYLAFYGATSIQRPTNSALGNTPNTGDVDTDNLILAIRDGLTQLNLMGT